jgi:hypothetical protein
VFTNFTMRKHCTFDNYVLDVATFSTVTPLSLLISRKLSFPIVDLKISYPPTLALKSPNKFLTAHLGH